MAKTFELETLKMRLNDAEFQLLDLHQRIQRALRELILDGALDPGLKLPATRVLAKSLGIARDTVENAYVQLHRDGFIVRREGAGSYVSETVGTELRGVTRRRIKAQEVKSSQAAPGGLEPARADDPRQWRCERSAGDQGICDRPAGNPHLPHRCLGAPATPGHEGVSRQCAVAWRPARRRAAAQGDCHLLEP